MFKIIHLPTFTIEATCGNYAYAVAMAEKLTIEYGEIYCVQ
jgi:hypothetical protein